MQELMAWISTHRLDILFLIGRLVVAYTFIPLGWQKLMAGEPKWLWFGTQMQNFGIYFFPIAWGFVASCAEFFGGVAMLLGLGVRIAAFFMICVMIVALRMHFANGDPSSIWVKPLCLLILLLGLMVAGAGKFSLDAYFKQ